ncbi:hypothetical protein H072_2954 [Dactylellina haptotyla CBS 200.50]|uniref:UBA domain-containing protein n=1 Tax=Dactylellina haptotyla (strain CBS 200.50) TaxID=1284197 RepID=S8C5Y6_DACHA|nr:hypothetical protein H072_2954 [Dactylellina haptotyla CBS 200.50]
MASLSKRQQQRNEKQLQDLITKVPGNNQCADCQTRNPGWASWSMMKKTGNVASNAIWNPDPHKHPAPVDLEDSDSTMERYIRDKYERGKFRRDAPSSGSRLLSAMAGVSIKRETSPAPKSRDGNLRSSSPFESKGSKILGMNGSVSIPPEYEAKVMKLKDMGFADEKQNAHVLKQTRGNMERAVELLIKMGGGTTSPVPPPKDRPVVKKQKSGLMLGGVKESKSSGGNPFDQLDQQEAAQKQQLQQQQLQQQQAQQQQAQIHAPQPQQAQQLFMNGQNGQLQNGMVQNGGLGPAQYNPFMQPQTTGYQQMSQQQQQQPQVYMNGNGQWVQNVQQNVQNPYQQAMLQQQQQQQAFAQAQAQQSIPTPLASPWGDVAPPQPQHATSHYTGSSASATQSPISATNPFFANQAQQTNPYMAQQQQQQQQQPFQQTYTPPLQQVHTNGALPVLFQPSPISPFQDHSQAFLQQQQPQMTPQFAQQNGGLAPAQPLVQQLTGRADKSTILQLYNYPQLAPPPSSIQQNVPGLPTQTRSVSTPAFPSSGSNNPFASKMNGSALSPLPGPDVFGKAKGGSMRGHMTQESVDFVALQNGRHSPDAFTSLSANFRHR